MAEVMAGVVWSVVELWVSLFTYCKIGSGENGLEMGWAIILKGPAPVTCLLQLCFYPKNSMVSPNSVTIWTLSAQAYGPWEDISDVKP